MNFTLVLITAFMIKHFAADFPLQGAYQLRNKGRLGHLGGFIHVYIHLLLSLLVLTICFQDPWTFNRPIIGWLLLMEGVIHYSMDYTKCQLVSRFDLHPNNPRYWWLTGFDQLVHGLTYVGMVSFLT